MPADDSGKLAVASTLNSLATSYANSVAIDLKVCDTCTEDKLGALLKSVTKPVAIDGVEIAPPMLDLVNKALSYPFRDLLVSWQNDETTGARVVLAQGIPTGGADNHAYFIQNETLAEGRTDFNYAIGGDMVETLNADGELENSKFTTGDPGANAFGFIVPTSLPDLAGTPQAIAEELSHIPGLNVRLGKPEVTLDVSSNGEGTGTIAGWIEPGQLQVLADAGTDLKPFIDANSGAIRAVLSFKLSRATVESAIDAHAIALAPPSTLTFATGTPLTSDHPLPPVDRQGVIADCLNCDSNLAIASQVLAPAGAAGPAIVAPIDFLRVNGMAGTETLKLRVLDAKTKPRLGWFSSMKFDTATPNGFTMTAGAKGYFMDYTVSVPYRSGMVAHPRCADLMTAGKPIASFPAKDGWVVGTFTPTNGLQSATTRQIVLCFDYSAQACGANSNANLDGKCECTSDSVLWADECLKTQNGMLCPANAELAKDQVSGTLICECPWGMSHVGDKCVPHACSSKDPRKSNETCAEDDKTGKRLCESTLDSKLSASLWLSRTSDTKFKKFFGAKREQIKGGKTDTADDETDPADLESGEAHESGAALGDEEPDADDEKADAATSGRGPIRQKPPMGHIHSLTFFHSKLGFRFKENLKRKVSGEEIAAAGHITKLRSHSGDVHDITFHIDDENYKALMAAKKASLPNQFSMEYSKHHHDKVTRKYFKAHHNGGPTLYVLGAIAADAKMVNGKHEVRMLFSNEHPTQKRHINNSQDKGRNKKRQFSRPKKG